MPRLDALRLDAGMQVDEALDRVTPAAPEKVRNKPTGAFQPAFSI